jgi:hypothetical protein
MSTYRLFVTALVISSFISALLEIATRDKKGSMYTLHMLFTAITLALVLAIGYRAFFLVR